MKALRWTLLIVVLLAILFVLIGILDHISGNFDTRNYGFAIAAIETLR